MESTDFMPIYWNNWWQQKRKLKYQRNVDSCADSKNSMDIWSRLTYPLKSNAHLFVEKQLALINDRRKEKERGEISWSKLGKKLTTQ